MQESFSRPRPPRLRWQALWQLHPPVALVVRATQSQCLQTLYIAAKPSADRLHLRNVFADGRRYYVQPQQDGFKLVSDNRLPWGGRSNRSRVAAVVYGKFSNPDAQITLVRVHSRMNIPYLLSGLLLPVFFAAIVISMPWPRLLEIILVALLFVLSLAGYRFNAALQVNEMIYFVQKAFADLPAVELGALPPRGADVTMQNSDFREQWYRFYNELSRNDEKR